MTHELPFEPVSLTMAPQIRTPGGLRIQQPPSVILALLMVTGFSLWNGPEDACREAMLDNVLLAEVCAVSRAPRLASNFGVGLMSPDELG